MEVRTLADGLDFPEGSVAFADGSVILVENAAGVVTRVKSDGSRTIVARPGGGPTVPPSGPDGKCWVCNTMAVLNGSLKTGVDARFCRPTIMPATASNALI